MANVPAAIDYPQAVAAPYLPFARFIASLDALAGCMPDRVDRTLWSGESPYLATVLVTAYAFLGLVDANGAPTALLQRLATDPARRPATLREVLERAYGDVLATVSNARTSDELEQALSRFRVSGNTHRKAVSFLLQACRYAGIPVSRELTGRMRVSHAKSTPAGQPPVETTTITVTLQSGGELTLSGRFNPFTLSAEDRYFVFKLVDELSAYKVNHRVTTAMVDDEEVPF